MSLINDIIKGAIMGAIYLEVTQTNDTTLYNILMYTLFFLIMTNSAVIAGIDPNVVVNAFVTKTIFTLVDERVKKKKET
jgi:hypothetical protein